MAQGLEEIIHQSSLQNAQFEEQPFKTLEILIYECLVEPLVIESTLTPPCDLQRWLRKQDIPPHSTTDPGKCEHKIRGALRVIYQEWSEEERQDMLNDDVIPFARDELRTFLDELQIPHSCIDDMVNGDSSFRIETTENRRSMICQAPMLRQTFMTMALGYDMESKITTVYLGYVKNSSGGVFIQDVLANLRSAKIRASHPSLLPTLTLQIWTIILRDEIEHDQKLLRGVQEEIENMHEQAERSERRSTISTESLDELHKKLIDVQRYLTSAIPDFVSEFARSLTDEAGNLKVSGHASSDCSQWDSEIKSCISHLQGMTRRQMERRDRLLSRHEMQLKALYTVMQQRDSFMNYQIAVAAKADSSAMRIISVVTMVFLPPTAVATIFSMSPFFAGSEDLLAVDVSPKFWLYWAVAIPLTVLVLLVWSCWLRWNDSIRPFIRDKMDPRMKWQRSPLRQFRESKPSTRASSPTSRSDDVESAM